MIGYVLMTVAVAAVGYLLGSINAAVIISKLLYKTDIRQHGSGNAGMTNMLRTFGKKAALLTFLVDFFKGVVACIIAVLVAHIAVKEADLELWNEIFKVAAGAGAVLGHNWPAYFGFKGGKGVLTSLAIMLFVVPIPTLIALGVFIIVVALTRYVSLGSMLAAFCLPFIVFFAGDYLLAESGFTASFVFCVFLASLLIIRHRTNIVRLVKGTESKIFSKK